jgi:AraC family transcriptional regulator, regulatory protein of adaptative response / DNA-3-methyladenine glycosylase II
MSVTDVAFAAGFGSVRQFNDTFRQVFATSPTAARRSTTSRQTARTAAPGTRRDRPAPGSTAVRCERRDGVRRPASDPGLRGLGRRGLPAVARPRRRRRRRHARRPHRPRVGTVRPVRVVRPRRRRPAGATPARPRQRSGSGRGGAVGRPADGEARRGGAGPAAPASVDPFETAVRAIIGQQVSVAGARTVAARIVDAVGTPIEGERITRTFPAPRSSPTHPMTRSRCRGFARDTIRRLAAAVAEGSVELHVGADPDVVRAQLLALRGSARGRPTTS